MGATTNRPKTRTLVRWNDDLDKELMLWIIWCCGEGGMKLPFARIAKCMGPTFSEGAIVQHLAKIRTKMDQAGLHVPPAQKRGTVTRTGSSIYRPKPKSVDDPVPRVRAAMPPASRNYSFYDDDDDDEEEEEESCGSTQRRTTARKTVVPSTSQKLTRNLKVDSDEDDPVPNLSDSDKEYGAKSMTASPDKEKSESGLPGHKQLKLKFDQTQQTALTEGNAQPSLSQGRSNATQEQQRSPTMKFEPTDDRITSSKQLPVAAPLVTRRKSSAMTAADDDGDDEYDPRSEGKGRVKKPRSTRASNKSKVDVRGKSRNKKSDSIDWTVFQEDAAHDQNHTDMPPPAIPDTNVNFSTKWNNNFMQKPFGSSNVQPFRYNAVAANDARCNDISPSCVQPQNTINTPNMAGSHLMAPSAYTYPSYDYSSVGMASMVSGSNSRNDSFASSGTNSTVESQPTAWNKQFRPRGFANPREASAALHATVNTPRIDDLTQFNVYSSPSNDPNLWNGYGDIFVGTSLEEVVPQPGATGIESHSRFVGMPEMTDKDINFTEFFNDQLPEPYNINFMDPKFSFTDYLEDN